MSAVFKCLTGSVALTGAVVLAGCSHPSKRYTTNVEIQQVQAFGRDPKTTPTLVDVEMKFLDCPGDARKVIRAEKAADACVASLKKGDKVEAEIVTTYVAATSSQRAEVVRLGTCPVKTDPKDSANYEIVQVCTDVLFSGVPIGVHCDRKREGEIVEKCPWFKRR